MTRYDTISFDSSFGRNKMVERRKYRNEIITFRTSRQILFTILVNKA